MRLVHLFDYKGAYTRITAEMSPYGAKQARWFADGEAELQGPHLSGTIAWTNLADRREDGAWLGLSRGSVRTRDGGLLLVTLDSEAFPTDVTDIVHERQVWKFTTDNPRYAWLNRAFVVGEGETDDREELPTIHGRVYAIINEVARPARDPTEPGAQATR